MSEFPSSLATKVLECAGNTSQTKELHISLQRLLSAAQPSTQARILSVIVSALELAPFGANGLVCLQCLCHISSSWQLSADTLSRILERGTASAGGSTFPPSYATALQTILFSQLLIPGITLSEYLRLSSCAVPLLYASSLHPTAFPAGVYSQLLEGLLNCIKDQAQATQAPVQRAGAAAGAAALQAALAGQMGVLAGVLARDALAAVRGGGQGLPAGTPHPDLAKTAQIFGNNSFTRGPSGLIGCAVLAGLNAERKAGLWAGGAAGPGLTQGLAQNTQQEPSGREGQIFRAIVG